MKNKWSYIPRLQFVFERRKQNCLRVWQLEEEVLVYVKLWEVAPFRSTVADTGTMIVPCGLIIADLYTICNTVRAVLDTPQSQVECIDSHKSIQKTIGVFGERFGFDSTLSIRSDRSVKQTWIYAKCTYTHIQLFCKQLFTKAN